MGEVARAHSDGRCVGGGVDGEHESQGGDRRFESNGFGEQSSGDVVTTDGQTPTPIHRVKGGAALNVFLMRGDTVQLVRSGETFYAGDRLRFEIKSASGGHVLILGRESKGDVYVAYPLDEQGSAVLEPGHREIPGALELDDSLGQEHLYAFVCPESFSASSIQWVGAEPTTPDGCQRSTFILNKAAH